jgi:hypothetical protein
MAKSRLVSVELAAPYSTVKYVFYTPIKESESTALGHAAVTAETAVAKLIFKANYPKPRRAFKQFATHSTQSFISESSIATASTAGWDISKSKSNGRKSNGRFSVVVYVTLNGIKYGWSIRKVIWAKISGSAKTYGIVEAKPTDNLVFGASFPKPPRVIATVVTGEETSKHGTFYDPSKKDSLPTGIVPKPGSYTQSDWADVA